MESYLIDTNVCLDAALLRTGNNTVLKILSASETGQFEGIIAAHAPDTIFYIIAHQIDRKAAYKTLNGLSKTVQIGTINQSVFMEALQAEWKDFEDALHYYCAIHHSCKGIITRNTKDFKKSSIPVFTPEEFVANHF